MINMVKSFAEIYEANTKEDPSDTLVAFNCSNSPFKYVKHLYITNSSLALGRLKIESYNNNNLTTYSKHVT